MLYLVKKVNVEFQVLEESTGLNIFSSPNPEEAEKMRRFSIRTSARSTGSQT